MNLFTLFGIVKEVFKDGFRMILNKEDDKRNVFYICIKEDTVMSDCNILGKEVMVKGKLECCDGKINLIAEYITLQVH